MHWNSTANLWLALFVVILCTGAGAWVVPLWGYQRDDDLFHTSAGKNNANDIGPGPIAQKFPGWMPSTKSGTRTARSYWAPSRHNYVTEDLPTKWHPLFMKTSNKFALTEGKRTLKDDYKFVVFRCLLDEEYCMNGGSQLPTLKPNILRLYSQLYCPFAQRTRLVLLHKKIPHEIVNVNLRFKPEWLWERNPLGEVPILEENEKVMYGSTVCNEYLDAVYPGRSLFSPIPYDRARQKQLMQLYDNWVIPNTIVELRRENTTQGRERSQIMEKLQYFENYLGDKYFGGKELDIVDYHMYTFFERFPAIRQLNGFDMLPTESFPKLTTWLHEMYKTEAVQQTRCTTEAHMEFIIHYALKEPIYDFDPNITAQQRVEALGPI